MVEAWRSSARPAGAAWAAKGVKGRNGTLVSEKGMGSESRDPGGWKRTRYYISRFGYRQNETLR